MAGHEFTEGIIEIITHNKEIECPVHQNDLNLFMGRIPRQILNWIASLVLTTNPSTRVQSSQKRILKLTDLYKAPFTMWLKVALFTSNSRGMFRRAMTMHSALAVGKNNTVEGIFPGIGILLLLRFDIPHQDVFCKYTVHKALLIVCLIQEKSRELLALHPHQSSYGASRQNEG